MGLTKLPARYIPITTHGVVKGDCHDPFSVRRIFTNPIEMRVRRNVIGYDDRLTMKLKASPAGGAQMKSTVTPKCSASADIGVEKGLLSCKRSGKGVTPSLASSWRTRAKGGQ